MATISSFVKAALLLCLLLVCFSTTASAAIVQWSALTVAGENGAMGNADGFPGVSRLFNPTGICGTSNANNLLIGSSNAFRTFQVDNKYLGTWFSGTPSAGNPVTGPVATASVANPYSCTNRAGTVYFVVSNTNIMYVWNDVVYAVSLPSASAVAIAITEYNGKLYVVDQRQSTMYVCDVADLSGNTNPNPNNCTANTLSSMSALGTQRGIAVSSRGIFVATGDTLNWYDLNTYNLVETISTLNFVDVRFALSSDQYGVEPWLFATTSSAIYTITFSTTNVATVSLLTGTPGNGEGTQQCSLAYVKDGANPTFCDNYRIYPLANNRFYVTSARGSTVRLVYLPLMEVNVVLPPPPFPINFVDANQIMPSIYALMEEELNKALGTTGVTVNQSSGVVLDDANWATSFIINIPQSEYNPSTTVATIQGLTFTKTLNAVAAYYARTNIHLYADGSILPWWNSTEIKNLQLGLTNEARDLLKYPYIYTTPAYMGFDRHNPNTTAYKLLLPEPFGVNNRTTLWALGSTDANPYMLDEVRQLYDINRTMATVTLPGNQYRFHRITKLSTKNQQVVRWAILNAALNQLNHCAVNRSSSDSSRSSNELSSSAPAPAPTPTIVGCKPSITNYTETTNSQLSGPAFEYTLFLPACLNYDQDRVVDCLAGTDWSFLDGLISSLLTKNPACNTGCIVGIAVAAAVVAAILIILLVVFTSKRKRLAAAVAPWEATSANSAESGPGPKFQNTVDLDTYDDDDVAVNPLQ